MSSLPVPPFLNGHVPNGNDKAKLIDALVTFGQWVKQTTDTARQAAEAAAASVNAENIIQRTLARVPDPQVPMKVDVVTSSKTVPVPTGAKAAKITVRAGALSTAYYGGNNYYVSHPEYSHWVRIDNERQANVIIGASGSGSSLGHSEVAIGSKKVRGRKGIITVKNSNYSEWLKDPENSYGELNTIHGCAIIEWYKSKPEGL